MREVTNVEEEIGTLLVRNTAVRIIGILSFFELDNKSLILGAILVLFQCFLQSLVTDEVGKGTVGW